MKQKEIVEMTDDQLRLAAGGVLKPGPWEHRWVRELAPNWHRFVCAKAGCAASYDFPSASEVPPGNLDAFLSEQSGPCLIPAPDNRPLEVVAEQLVRMFSHKGSSSLALIAMDMQGASEKQSYDVWFWWIFFASPAERIECCLSALKKCNPRPEFDTAPGPIGDKT